MIRMAYSRPCGVFIGGGYVLRTRDSADKTPAQQVGAEKTLPSPLRIRGQVTATIPKGAHDLRLVIPAQAGIQAAYILRPRLTVCSTTVSAIRFSRSSTRVIHRSRQACSTLASSRVPQRRWSA